MAKTSLTFACIFLLVFILCHEVVYIEGRHLKKPGLCRKCSNTMNARAHGSGGHGKNAKGLNQQIRTSKVEYGVDDFRPTAPGHSPGVGHSINN
ncbi:Precursor of CEP3 [Quillaja saponaria]|uniref:Precursor of CEP3 n=1 Tax=Quillaja saponaria TaxID=32244 RepID=A0AAD7KRC5_QUISA|nr:Precursor of CEP3 [Quillaja saponaria]